MYFTLHVSVSGTVHEYIYSEYSSTVECRSGTMSTYFRPVAAVVVAAVGLGFGLGLPHDSSTCGALNGTHNGTAATHNGTDWTAYVALSDVLGWTYFASWSISFWPQLIMNWERHSVIGLSFDFIYLNLAGFSCYAAYNLGLFFVPAIQREYEHAHPGSSGIPVKLNDVVFTLHAVFASSVGMYQVRTYERGAQSSSYLCRAALVAFALFAAVAAAVIAAASRGRYPPPAGAAWATWFTYLYALSFIKLTVTLTKYASDRGSPSISARFT